jgi:hypothetical protein
MFPIAGDGQNGYLAPWTLGASDGSLQESRVTHITANGRQDYVLPLAGQIYRLGSDLGVMTDGKTVVAFHLMSGEVKWTRVVTAGTVKILPVPGKPEIYLQLPGGTELVDEFGRPVNGAPR